LGGIKEGLTVKSRPLFIHIALGAIVISAAALVAATPAGASSGSRFTGAAPGQVTCTFSGKIQFSPPLTATGGGTNPSTVTGKETNCASTVTAVSISKGTVSGSFTSSPIACTGPAAAPASATLTTEWKGAVNGTIGATTYSGKADFTDSSSTFSGADLTDGDHYSSGIPFYYALDFPGSGATSAVTGSFAGSTPKGALAVLNIPRGIVCSSKSGLKSLSLTGTIIDGSISPTSVNCCTAPPGSPGIMPLEPGYNLPDPAMVPTSGTTADVYSTESWEGGYTFYNVPSYSVDLTDDSYGAIHDALPTPPSWYGSPNYLFAPTVRYIDGRYVMLFAASPGTNALCIGEATSTDGSVFVANNSFEVCTPGYSNYDPYLFTDPNSGDVWMFYSLENNGPSGTGTIEAQQLSTDATTLVGSPSTLLSYSQVASLNPNEGSAPFLENPTFVADPGNGYGFDLIDALGTFNGADTYATIEVPCTSETGGCQPSAGQVMTGPGYGDDPGSASLLYDGSPTGNTMIWDVWINGARMDFIGPTSASS